MEEYIFLAVFHFKMKELNWVSERLGKLTQVPQVVSAES